MNSLTLSSLCLGVLAVGPSSAATGDGFLKLGEIAEHEFKQPLINALGVTSLQDLRGKPVLVAFWGHTTWADDWVEDVLAWQLEYGEDLAVIFCEMQAASLDTIEATIVQKSWFHTRAMWTTRYVAYSGVKGMPQYSLISGSGELLKTGKSAILGCNFVPRRLEELADAIAEQVRIRRSGPEDLPKTVSKAWKDFAKGKIGNAFERLRGQVAEGQDQEAAQASLAELEHRVGARLDRTTALLAEGRFVEAEQILEPLEKQLEQEAQLHERVQGLRTDLDAETNAEEREASEALAKIEKKLLQKGPSDAVLRSLAKLIKKFPGTKNATRAERLVELASKKT